MPKVKASHYVLTLDALTQGHSATDVKQNFAGFLRLLVKNNQLDQIDNILALYQTRLDASQDEITAQVYSEQPPSTSDQQLITDFLRQRFQVRSVNLQLYPDQIGPGIIVDAGASRFNFSLEHQLANFKEQLLTT